MNTIKNSQTSNVRRAARMAALRSDIFQSLHRGANLPRLDPPLRTRCHLARIEQFVQARIGVSLALCLAVAALGTGCTVIRYQGPSGERFSRAALGSSTSLDSLEVEAGTNGVRRILLHGYRNDSADALGAVTEAAVRAALQGK